MRDQGGEIAKESTREIHVAQGRAIRTGQEDHGEVKKLWGPGGRSREPRVQTKGSARLTRKK